MARSGLSVSALTGNCMRRAVKMGPSSFGSVLVGLMGFGDELRC